MRVKFKLLMIHLVSKDLFSHEKYKKTSIDEAIAYLMSQETLAFDTESEGLDPYIDRLFCIQLGTKEHQYVIDVRHHPIRLFKEILEEKTLIGVNLKHDLKFVYVNDIYPTKIIDLMLNEVNLTNGLYEVGETKGKYTYENLARVYLGVTLDKSTGIEFTRKDYGAPLTVREILYSAKDVEHPIDIYNKQKEKIDKWDLEPVCRLENKFVLTLAAIELQGILLNRGKWMKLYEKHRKELEIAKTELDSFMLGQRISKFIDPQLDLFDGNRRCGVDWNSPKEVLKVMEHFKIPTKVQDRKSGKEKDSVDSRVIGKNKHPIVERYVKYKEAEKLISTYGLSMFDYINPETGRIHSSFWQILTTGRISSTRPNLQNIPAEGEIRECFEAGRGNVLLTCDYSSQEPRVIADKSRDPAMIDFFMNGNGDIHSYVSSKLFSVIEGKEVIIPPKIEGDEVAMKIFKSDPSNNKKRQIGKILNLKLDYGGTAYTVKDDLNTDEKEAQKFIDALAKAFPVKQQYFLRAIADAMDKGYIQTDNVTKRKIFIKGFDKFRELQTERNDWKNLMKMKGQIERNSKNFPIQSTSASMCKCAAIMIYEEFTRKELKAWIVNLIHDEILVECEESISAEVSKIAKDCMERAGKIFCPIVPMIVQPSKNTYWAK